MQVRLTIENSSGTRKYGARINVFSVGHRSHHSTMAKFLFVTAGVVFAYGAQAQMTTEPVKRDTRLSPSEQRRLQITTEPVKRETRLLQMEPQQRPKGVTEESDAAQLTRRQILETQGLSMRHQTEQKQQRLLQ